MFKQLMRNASGILSSLTQLGVVFEHWLKHDLWDPATSHTRYKIREAAGMTKRMPFTLCCNEKKGRLLVILSLQESSIILSTFYWWVLQYSACVLYLTNRLKTGSGYRWIRLSLCSLVNVIQRESKPHPRVLASICLYGITRMKNKGISKISNLNGIVVLPIFFSISFLVICPENVYKLVICSAMEWILLRWGFFKIKISVRKLRRN